MMLPDYDKDLATILDYQIPLRRQSCPFWGWRKDYYGYPIETYAGKPIKSFYRLVGINIKKPFQWVYWWWRRRKGPEKFETMAFPVIKRTDYQKAAKELISVQPERLPAGLVFYLDYKYSKDSEYKPHNPETRPPLTWDTSRY